MILALRWRIALEWGGPISPVVGGAVAAIGSVASAGAGAAGVAATASITRLRGSYLLSNPARDIDDSASDTRGPDVTDRPR